MYNFLSNSARTVCLSLRTKRQPLASTFESFPANHESASQYLAPKAHANDLVTDVYGLNLTCQLVREYC